MSHWEDVPMFEVVTPPVAMPERPKPVGTVRWAKYQPKQRVKCDDCMLLLLQRKGWGPAARLASHRRVADDGDLFLCDAHAQAHREEDEK